MASSKEEPFITIRWPSTIGTKKRLKLRKKESKDDERLAYYEDHRDGYIVTLLVGVSRGKGWYLSVTGEGRRTSVDVLEVRPVHVRGVRVHEVQMPYAQKTVLELGRRLTRRVRRLLVKTDKELREGTLSS